MERNNAPNSHQKILRTTLGYLINVQEVIIVQAGKFPKINKLAGCNKAMQVGIFQKIKDAIFQEHEIKML